MNDETKTYCGYVALVGRPNVGKSTLLNAILERKLSITSNKPQTTRNRLLGIKTQGDTQTIYVDTPGIKKFSSGKKQRGLNRYLDKAAQDAIVDVDLLVFIVEGLRFSYDDEWILQKLIATGKPILLVINKIDTIKDKDLLLPHIDKLLALHDFSAIIPMSGRKKSNVEALEQEISKLLPENPFFFAKDDITDRDSKFYCSEIIREKLFYAVGAEVPHSVAVQIEKFTLEKEVLHIGGLIWVERSGQKAIVIGKDGEKLKQIGTQARKELENYFGQKVFLKLWVKVKNNWADDERALMQFGY